MLSPVSIDWSKVDNPELVFQRFASRRSVVYGTKGMVSSSQPLATEAGLEILRKGGNAADAAVATSAALNVTEPSCCGIGGDAFCLFYDAKTKAVKALNGSGRAPVKLDIDYLLARGLKGSIPLTDLNSVTVPGAAAAWVDTIATFGSGSVTIADIFEPAIRLAEEGQSVPFLRRHPNLDDLYVLQWQRSEVRLSFPSFRIAHYRRIQTLIKNASPNGDEMLLNGKAPLPGQIIKLPNLARTFKEVVAHGKDGFYKGRVAEAIVDLIQSKGGLMELEDLASHTSAFVEPIKYTYANEVTVYECPPNGQGITALLALGILENIQEQGLSKPLSEMEHNSPDYLHTLIEALRYELKLTTAKDSQYYVTDPDVEHIPVEQLLSKASIFTSVLRYDYLASRARLFDSSGANPRSLRVKTYYIAGQPSQFVRHFTDQWGNACSYIQSNYAAVPKGCGFTLQNRGSGFTLDKNHPNSLKGGKRPYHTIIPALATKGDELFLSYGVMGGFMQVLLNMLRGFTPQTALDAPRFCISAGIPDAESNNTGAAGDINSEVYFEDGISKETVETLRKMGHDARLVSGFNRGLMGRGQVIQRLEDPSGRFVWAAGSDLRADGHAAAQI
ncbi:hypothetical protein CVT25_005681 [Psilocybe cyanescens]|uniref:Gamma-glutamyltransferase n=1 Tax=Psilocybe cyanescens TaxID=93625 RepID=A0A409VLE4_PSICY|nr:hypothetical protein CVT25_005681 [Psilocybe cyanescens]